MQLESGMFTKIKETTAAYVCTFPKMADRLKSEYYQNNYKDFDSYRCDIERQARDLLKMINVWGLKNEILRFGNIQQNETINVSSIYGYCIADLESILDLLDLKEAEVYFENKNSAKKRKLK